MKKFNSLSSLQRRFIRNCFIVLGVIAWFVFGIISAFVIYWDTGCLIFSSPFICFGVFIIIYGIRLLILRLRFKWKIMGVLTMEEYDSVIHELRLSGWDFDEMYNELWVSGWDPNKMCNVETGPAVLEVLDKVRPFWNDRLEW